MFSPSFARRDVPRRPRTRASGAGQFLERLESRLALSLATAFDGVHLSVTGLYDQAEQVTLAVDSARTITVNGARVYHTEATAGPTGKPIVIKIPASLDNTQSITVDTGGGNDTIDLSRLTGYQGATDLCGGAGDDTIFGSPVGDFIDGGNGVDVLYGGAGNDDMYGGLDHDVLYGGDGNDHLCGGRPSTLDDNTDNELHGGAGDDFLEAWWDRAPDLLWGDAGADTFAIDSVDRVFDVNGSEGDQVWWEIN
jgi:Ca2+-binding RTX toxin-like protein